MTTPDGRSTETTIRPFRIDVPEEDLVDLRQRIAATRWPDRETVPDRSQGAQLAEMQELVRYWGGREEAARPCPQVLLRPLLRPRRPARQLRALSRVGHHPRAERAAQEPAAYDA